MTLPHRILVATDESVLALDPRGGSYVPARGLDGRRPTALAADPRLPHRAWCATRDQGVFRSDDGGTSWRSAGLRGHRVMAVAASPSVPDRVWAGTEPSELFRSDDGGERWTRVPGLQDLPSASEWSFPPRPETHHVRWIACHPREEGRLWLAVEAGALVRTPDGGGRWEDRVPDGPRDTHELAVDPRSPDRLHAAAGDGYFESVDGGGSWSTPSEGLGAGYLRSVALGRSDGGEAVVVISAASGPRTAYDARGADGRVYRRRGTGRWSRVVRGWPEEPATMAPLLRASADGGRLWAVDERGVHESNDAGESWTRSAEHPVSVTRVSGMAILG